MHISALSLFLDFFFPPRCAACDMALEAAEGRIFCKNCFASLERVREPWCERCGIPISGTVTSPTVCGRCRVSPAHFEKARALFRYSASSDGDSSPLSVVLRRHKYGLDQALVRALRQCLEGPLPLGQEGYDLVLPVPLHSKRLRWRGFNQAALIAREVARKLGLPLDVASLVRAKPTLPQTAQSRDERLQNVRGVFKVTRPWRIRGRRILLVDDVMTTGATADECARALLESGAAFVHVLTLARAL